MKFQAMPPINKTSEFNLQHAPLLTCNSNNNPSTLCGVCENCKLTAKLNEVNSWFSRVGDQHRKYILQGLIFRIESGDLLKQLYSVLHPLSCKDYTYARMRTQPSLSCDQETIGSDRALNLYQLEHSINETWMWFNEADYWTKAKFITSLMCACESHLLNVIRNDITTHLDCLKDENSGENLDVYSDSESIPSTSISFHSNTNPDLHFLTQVKNYLDDKNKDKNIKERPEKSKNSKYLDNSKLKAQSPSSFLGHSESSKKDVPYGTKTLDIYEESGDEGFCSDLIFAEELSNYKVDDSLSRPKSSTHCDFIHLLPVHLSKFVLGFLDKCSLNNTLCVSQKWRSLSQEVLSEFYMQQQLNEEVMLMQGAAAQACNPLYAKDVDIHVPNVVPGTREVIKIDQPENTAPDGYLKSAFAGCSTRKIICEERNVFCGAYNVMVLSDLCCPSRVMHADEKGRIVLGFYDRKLRFIDSETGAALEPTITGHAGSIKCVAVCEAIGKAFSGSYDTSIRSWSLKTGKCIKIYRGHRDTIVMLKIYKDLLASGSKDKTCKVWNIETAKCLYTFKHHKPITSVALSEDFCVSGCAGGKVKVWDMNNGHFIKKLTGHHDAVTCMQFNKWHLVTGSLDGYVLLWSIVGDFRRCLQVLRHPKQVLCLEFLYMRVISGCEDGKLRLWNVLTGQCMRIMRGNSHNDPITTLVTFTDKLIFNTTNTLLSLNFEPMNYDYTLKDDSMPSKVQYSRYSEAPIRTQPYPYIRARRMEYVGSANAKIVHHNKKSFQIKSDRISHSARSLSRQSVNSAKRVQQSRPGSAYSAPGRFISSRVSSAKSTKTSARDSTSKISHTNTNSSFYDSHKLADNELARQIGAHGDNTQHEQQLSTSKQQNQEELSAADAKRRVSWGFERLPVSIGAKALPLANMKQLLRSQIRQKPSEITPPDYIYLSVNAIQKKWQRPTQPVSFCTDENLMPRPPSSRRGSLRPSSSPSRIDPRTKVPVDQLEWEQFLQECGLETSDNQSDSGSRVSHPTQVVKAKKSVQSPDREEANHCQRETVVTPMLATPLKLKRASEPRSGARKSTIPPAELIRPTSASQTLVEELRAKLTEYLNLRVKPENFPSPSRKTLTSEAPGIKQTQMMIGHVQPEKKINELRQRRRQSALTMNHY